MSSVAIQADILDPEGALGIVRALKEQLTNLQDAKKTFLDLRRSCDVQVTETELEAEKMEEKITQLLDGLNEMERKLQNDNVSSSTEKQEILQLINESAQLESSTEEQEQVLSNSDFGIEQKLIVLIEEELFQKMEDLSIMHQRFSNVLVDYTNEWNEYKEDNKRYASEKATIETDADILEELILVRYMGSQASRDINPSDSDVIQRLVAQHWNKITHRNLQQEILYSQLLERDLEEEIGALIRQKKELWNRSLGLESYLDDIRGGSETSNLLRPYCSLPNVNKSIFLTESVSDIEFVLDNNHGRHLHRCAKQTNIAIEYSPMDLESSTSVQVTKKMARMDLTSSVQDLGVEDSYTSFFLANSVPVEPEQSTPVHESEAKIETAAASSNAVQRVPFEKGFDQHSRQPQSLLSKLRMRIGKLGTRSSSSVKIKGGVKLAATESERRFIVKSRTTRYLE